MGPPAIPAGEASFWAGRALLYEVGGGFAVITNHTSPTSPRGVLALDPLATPSGVPTPTVVGAPLLPWYHCEFCWGIAAPPVSMLSMVAIVFAFQSVQVGFVGVMHTTPLHDIVLDYELPNNPFQPWSEHSASQRQGNK